MKTISTAIAALAISMMTMTGAPNEAKADGGAVAIGVGAYLIADAIVGRKCHRDEWPFNFIGKIADEIHGRQGCHRYGYHEDHHDRHHRHRKYR